MGKKTPPCPKWPLWTTARYNQFIRSALRAAYNKWPAKYKALENARRVVKGKRHRYEYQCAHCKEWFKQKEGKKSLVQCDHIIPVENPDTWDEFIDKLFVGVEGFQILCVDCHQIKTNEERKIRDGKGS